jgi:Cro/C1-type HTH DNA-binding domain
MPHDVSTTPDGMNLATKIARLVEERGWNLEDFARISKLNRNTVRAILKYGSKRLRNATVSQCASALGLQVHELRNLPLERLIPRMHGQLPVDEASLTALFERATLPELASWLQRHQDRAAQLTPEEVQELLLMQGPNGALARIGVEPYVELLERRRRLLEQVRAIAGTEYLGLLEQMVGLLYEKVGPGEKP